MDVIKDKDTHVASNDSQHCWWCSQNGFTFTFAAISLFSLLVRVSVSLHPYSGAENPPKFGDYEAQRHWMEITLNLPAIEWYRNGTQNDLTYWGLDYPPITAYQSYVHGLFIKHFHPDSVSLLTSWGHESYIGKHLMRSTVLFSDALVFFPAVLYFVIVYYAQHSSHSKCDIPWHIAIILLNPCLILIDHGHFQYNCISLGLTIGAVAAILSCKDLIASVLFCLALNHKQMSLYLAPAFFSHLLGKCLRCRKPLIEVLKLGLVVLGTFVLVWWPYVNSLDSIIQVLNRLAPFERGIYEDYVANFWCISSILIKWKRVFTTQFLKFLSFGATVSACMPSMVHQIHAPSKKGFLYGLLNSSLSFYLLSFQVHEKSILLPLLPASLLAYEEPLLFRWITHFALLSIFPLMCRDKLILPYMALFGLFILLYCIPARTIRGTLKMDSRYTLKSLAASSLMMCCAVLHVVYLFMIPPEKYPFIFEALIMLFCFSQFTMLAVYTNLKQWNLSDNFSLMNKEKKLI